VHQAESDKSDLKGKYEALKNQFDEQITLNSKTQEEKQKIIDDLEENCKQLISREKVGEVYKKKYEEFKAS
jgi:biotin-(acetyl-CoA carboxylase) ligase